MTSFMDDWEFMEWQRRLFDDVQEYPAAASQVTMADIERAVQSYNRGPVYPIVHDYRTCSCDECQRKRDREQDRQWWSTEVMAFRKKGFDAARSYSPLNDGDSLVEYRMAEPFEVDGLRYWASDRGSVMNDQQFIRPMLQFLPLEDVGAKFSMSFTDYERSRKGYGLPAVAGVTKAMEYNGMDKIWGDLKWDPTIRF